MKPRTVTNTGYPVQALQIEMEWTLTGYLSERMGCTCHMIGMVA
uniref:Uncharacterized protein n=1 Tax=Picea sitchensis TaxID=3332 RepID=A9NJT2_PICSI|nr:unknown [Picea sitchensis]